jgi:hypothetical protein
MGSFRPTLNPIVATASSHSSMEESGLQTERTDSSAPHEELYDDTYTP